MKHATQAFSDEMQSTHVCSKMAALIRENNETLLAFWRRKAREELHSDKQLDRPTLNDHIPLLLQELANAFDLEADYASVKAITSGASPTHGIQRFQHGFEIEEVVAEYNVLRNCIHDLAEKLEVNLQGCCVQILNRALDAAIGSAIKAYTLQEAQDTQRRREDYLAFVAHDLRTPLNAIALSAHIIELGLNDNTGTARAEQALKTMHRNVGYLKSLVDQVLEENVNLETESGFRLERRTFDLWPLVEALIHDLRPIAGSGSTVLMNQIPDDLVVFADASMLRRVFQNLVTNAIRHAPRGEVRISARCIDAENAVECSVTDNGQGIAANRIGQIFEKYETGGMNPTDTGLGLTIAKTFVEAHCGTITVQSTLGGGSRFYFTLPGHLSCSNPGK